jgi:MFS family permease
VFLAFRALQGAGSSALLNLAATVIGDHWEGTERSAMIGRNTAFVTVSIAILPTVGGLLTDFVGWQGPFFLFALAIPLGVAVWLRVPETDLPPAPSFGRQLSTSARFAVSRRMLVIVGLCVTVFVVLFGASLTIAPFHAEEVFGLSASARGLLLGLPAIAATIVATLLGRLVGRFGRVALVTTGGLVYAGAYLTMGVAPVVWLFAAAILVVGAAEGLTIPVLQDATLSGAPAERRGIAVSVFGSAARLGQTLGPAIAGVTLAGVGTRGSFWVFAAIATLIAVGAWGGGRVLRAAAAPA